MEDKEAKDKKLKVEEEERIAHIKTKEIDDKISQIVKYCSQIESESETDKTIENAADSEVLAFKDNFCSIACMITDIRYRALSRGNQLSKICQTNMRGLVKLCPSIKQKLRLNYRKESWRISS